MRKIVINIVLLGVVATAFLLSGCSSSGSGNSSTAANLKPGELRLAKMNGMGKVAAAVQGQISSATTFGNISSASSFDLGTIKGSQQFYFFLSNAGDIPVTDISLTTSNSNFVVTPGTIDALLPQRDLTIMPIIKVSVTHGIALNGTGYTNSILPMGDNTCILTLTGKTLDADNNVINLKYVINLKLHAYMMDVQLFDNNTSIDLTHDYKFFGLNVASGSVKGYKNNLPIIKNSGNVDITITNVSNGGSFPVLEQFTLKPTEQKTLTYVTRPEDNNKVIYLKIVSGNTITDYQKLKIEPDGSVYMVIHNIPFL